MKPSIRFRRRIRAEFVGGPWDGDERVLEADVVTVPVFHVSEALFQADGDPDAPAGYLMGTYVRTTLDHLIVTPFEWREGDHDQVPKIRG